MLFFKRRRKNEKDLINRDADEAEKERKLKMLCAMAVLNQFRSF